MYEDEYSTKSDVYSFAVLVFEIFSQGELPHSKINDNSFLTKLKENKLEWKSHQATPEPLQKLQVSSIWKLQNNPGLPMKFIGIVLGLQSSKQAFILPIIKRY